MKYVIAKYANTIAKVKIAIEYQTRIFFAYQDEEDNFYKGMNGICFLSYDMNLRIDAITFETQKEANQFIIDKYIEYAIIMSYKEALLCGEECMVK